MTNQFKDALDELMPIRGYCPDHFDEDQQVQKECAYFIQDNFETLRFALRIADKLMQEPSKGMCLAGYNHEWSGGYDRQGSHDAGEYMEYTESLRYSFGDSTTGSQAGEVWKAMRGKLLKEAGDE